MLEAVGSEGYAGTSVAVVAERAGMHRQAFYDNFGSKQECFELAYAQGLERLESRVVEAARGEDGWLAQLRAGLGSLLAFLDAEPAVGRALIVEVQAGGGPALAERDAALGRAMAFLARGREEAAGVPGAPTAPPIAPEATASGIHKLLHSRLAAGERGGFLELLPELMFVAVLPYFGPGMARAEMDGRAP
jgi:AcrR family transcriptional regulator